MSNKIYFNHILGDEAVAFECQTVQVPEHAQSGNLLQLRDVPLRNPAPSQPHVLQSGFLIAS